MSFKGIMCFDCFACLAASRIQIVSGWLPVTCIITKIGGQLPASGKVAQIVCDRLLDGREIVQLAASHYLQKTVCQASTISLPFVSKSHTNLSKRTKE